MAPEADGTLETMAPVRIMDQQDFLYSSSLQSFLVFWAAADLVDGEITPQFLIAEFYTARKSEVLGSASEIDGQNHPAGPLRTTS
jgi:hypothetical protein